MHFSQFGTLFYLLAPASGMAVRPYGGVPHARAVSSSAPSATCVIALASAVATGAPDAADAGQNISSLWTSAKCDQNSIDNATVAFVDR
ncbi:hypothetical protein N7453_001666 [Penicillium expansum]|nr:hypothetical protein N7453_001666 [Penicillium expansum]